MNLVQVKHKEGCAKMLMRIQRKPVTYRFICPTCGSTSIEFGVEALKANGWDKDFNVPLGRKANFLYVVGLPVKLWLYLKNLWKYKYKPLNHH